MWKVQESNTTMLGGSAELAPTEPFRETTQLREERGRRRRRREGARLYHTHVILTHHPGKWVSCQDRCDTKHSHYLLPDCCGCLTDD